MERTTEWSVTGFEHQGAITRRGSIPLRSSGEVTELVRGLTANEVNGKPSASSSLALSAFTLQRTPSTTQSRTDRVVRSRRYSSVVATRLPYP